MLILRQKRPSSLLPRPSMSSASWRAPKVSTFQTRSAGSMTIRLFLRMTAYKTWYALFFFVARKCVEMTPFRSWYSIWKQNLILPSKSWSVAWSDSVPLPPVPVDFQFSSCSVSFLSLSHSSLLPPSLPWLASRSTSNFGIVPLLLMMELLAVKMETTAVMEATAAAPSSKQQAFVQLDCTEPSVERLLFNRRKFWFY